MPYQFPLAVCAEMLWQDKPIEWRVSKLTEMGFAVGLWNWPAHDLDKLEKTKANFSIMNGYLRGRLADDEGAEELLAKRDHCCRETSLRGSTESTWDWIGRGRITSSTM